jgi:hypothetical protein
MGLYVRLDIKDYPFCYLPYDDDDDDVLFLILDD